VKAELFEDTRLAQIWRERGHRGLCLDGTGTVRVRMYDSLGGIWTGFRKNLFPAFRRQLNFWLFMIAHAGIFLLPFGLAWTALDGSTAGLLFAAAGAAVLMARIALALRFGHPLWSALLHPAGELFVLALGVASWLQVMTGRGVSWKGRRYRTKDNAPVKPAGEAA
jgi:chlorobactene glucosyltransferase